MKMNEYHLLLRDTNESVSIEVIPASAGDYVNLLLEEPEFYLNEGSPQLTIRISECSSPKYHGLEPWSIDDVKEYLQLN